jgi:N-acetylglucosaminyldiphosphoundecaprenol N-acetyl-beta-D-mannosaminyltransferase
MNEPFNILGLEIDHISFDKAIQKVKSLGLARISSYVCFANVHMVIEAYKDKRFAKQVNAASLVLPDGQPLIKLNRILNHKNQERIPGMEFMPKLLEAIKSKGFKIFLYGSDHNVLNTLQQKIREKYPTVELVGAVSPPFRKLSDQELNEYIHQINNSGAHIVFVSLGCPQQERWMAENHKKINAVLLGVGGAFSVTAELQKRAPVWMQENSLEWLFRLLREPRRLFKRYLLTNTLFIWLISKELIKNKLWTSLIRSGNPVGQEMKN